VAAGPRRLEWSASARGDLLAIDAWYAQFGEAAAERVIHSIVAAANGLSQYPFSGPNGIRPGTRHKIAGPYPYTIVYRVGGSSVRVIRVLHQRRAYFQRSLREELAQYEVKPRAGGKRARERSIASPPRRSR
jgi:plasmid stabilization system protein ParE